MDKKKKDKEKEKEKDENHKQVEKSQSLALAHETLRTEMERSLNELRSRAATLNAENEQLRKEKNEIQLDSLQVVNHLYEEVKTKQDRIDELQKDIQLKEKQLNKQKKDMDATFQKELTAMKNLQAQKDARIKELEEELETLVEFKQNRAVYMAELETTRNTLEEARKQHKETEERLEFKFYEEKFRLQKEFSHKIQELQKLAHEEAVAKLSETTKQLFVENRSMSEELRLQIQENEVLKTTKVQIEENNKILQREVELAASAAKQVGFIQVKRKKKISELKLRVKELEDEITKKGYTAKSEFARTLKMLEDTRLDNEGLRELLATKTKEMRRIKKLARQIIQQRTELEQFFLEALEEVKYEIAKNTAQMNASKPQTVSLPKISQKPNFDSGSSNSDFSKPPVDLSQMSWEDRERVLRLLFSKIKSPAKPQPAPEPPQEYFSSQPSSSFVTQQFPIISPKSSPPSSGRNNHVVN